MAKELAKEFDQPWRSAEREAFEEAGALGKTEQEPFSHYRYSKAKGNREDLIAAYLMNVDSDGAVLWTA